MKLKIFLLICTIGTLVKADLKYTAELFEQNSKKEKKLYDFKYSLVEEEGQPGKLSVEFTDLSGKKVFEESAVMNGMEIVKTEINQLQLNQKATIEVKDKMIYFTLNDGKKTKEAKEKLGKTFVMTSNFVRFVKSNWETILKGDEVSFRFGVWDRMETVGFEIFKTGEEVVNGQKVIILKMKPSSFVIAALVKPLIFKYSEDGSKLLEMNGRVAPKKLVGKDWEDLDAEVVYTFN